MDMKQILQALDKASSRKVEGADDMRRFVSAVRALNAPVNEAGKPGDPGFKPNLQVPQAPPFPEGDFSKPGSYDIGNGEKLTVNQDGTRVHAGASGTFTYDKAGKAIKYASPMFNGYSQEHDLVTGNITVKYMNGPMNIVKTYDKTGKETGDSNAEYDMGVQKVAQQKTAGGAVQNTVTPAGGTPQPAPAPAPTAESKKSFLDYVQMIEEGLKDPKDNPCWKGYKPVGTKKKGGRTVPNCVPKE